MIKRQLNNPILTSINFSLPENHTAYRILLFLKDSLLSFEKDFSKQNVQINLEDEISKQLSLFFQERAKEENLLFDFNPRIGVDFGIHVAPFRLGAKPIFMIEAKRLSKSHYDYVKGQNGGIERFKREQDGFGSHLKHSAMVGYIQDNDSIYWESKINNWIDRLIKENTDIVWNNNDRLVKEGKIAQYISKHKRVVNPDISLFHFWITVQTDNN